MRGGDRRSNPSGKCSQERLTRGTVSSDTRRAAHPSGCARVRCWRWSFGNKIPISRVHGYDIPEQDLLVLISLNRLFLSGVKRERQVPPKPGNLLQGGNILISNGKELVDNFAVELNL